MCHTESAKAERRLPRRRAATRAANKETEQGSVFGNRERRNANVTPEQGSDKQPIGKFKDPHYYPLLCAILSWFLEGTLFQGKGLVVHSLRSGLTSRVCALGSLGSHSDVLMRWLLRTQRWLVFCGCGKVCLTSVSRPMDFITSSCRSRSEISCGSDSEARTEGNAHEATAEGQV